MNLRCLPASDQFPLAWEYDDTLDRDRIAAAVAADLELPESERTHPPDFVTSYLQCVNTLDWSSLARPGEQPTLFWFRPIAGLARQRLKDMSCGTSEKHGLAFRLGLVRIEHGPTGLPKLDPKVDRDYPTLGPMLPRDAFEALARIETREGSLVEQLGMFAWTRSTDLLPL